MNETKKLSLCSDRLAPVGIKVAVRARSQLDGPCFAIPDSSNSMIHSSDSYDGEVSTTISQARNCKAPCANIIRVGIDTMQRR